jgi:hypothetical protein
MLRNQFGSFGVRHNRSYDILVLFAFEGTSRINQAAAGG